jgi:hypothetical protein
LGKYKWKWEIDGEISKATRHDFWAQHCSMKNENYFVIGPKLKKMEHNSFPNNREINCC